MRSLRRLLPALLLPLGAIVACGSDDDEGMTSAQFAAEYCALYRPCCQAAGFPQTSQQSCQTFFGFIPIQDRAAAQQCLDEWKAKASAPNFCKLTDEPLASSACARAFPQGDPVSGTAPPGAACEFASDCAESSRGEVTCHHSFDTSSSTCQVLVPASQGAPCGATKQGNVTSYTGNSSAPEVGVCLRDDGLYCDGGACKAAAPNGSACNDDRGCDNGWCSSGICAAKRPAGSSCGESPSACDDQSYCEFTDQTCHARVPVGSACESSEECLSGFCDGTRCGEFNPGSFGLILFCS
jgi:hypothetical protein